MNVVRHMLEEPACGTSQAAKMLQVSVGTIHHMVERGDLVAWLTVGGHRRISMDSIRNCQIRRKLHIAPDSLNMDIIVSVNDFELLTKIKFMLSPHGAGKNISFFSDPMRMVLSLDASIPQLILLDKASLMQLGGVSWFSQFREHKKYMQTQILMIGEALTSDETSSILVNKIDIVAEPLNESWFNGYMQALTTSFKLAC